MVDRMQVNLGDGTFVEFVTEAESDKEVKKLLKEHAGEGSLTGARDLRVWKVYRGSEAVMYVLKKKIYRQVKGPKKGLR